MRNNNIKIWYWSNSKLCTLVPTFETVPTEKKYLIEFNSSKSLSCKVIIKQGSIIQSIEAVLDLKIDIQKDPSASTKPVTHQGFKIEVLDIIFLLVVLYLICLKTYVLKKLEWLFKNIKLI